MEKEVVKDSEIALSSNSYFTNKYTHKYVSSSNKESDWAEKKYAVMNADVIEVPFTLPEMPNIKEDSKMDYLSSLVNVKISLETCNGKECYKITNLKNIENSENLTSEENISIYENVYYVEKETGLLIKTICDNIDIEYEYNFNIVTEKDLEEPELSEYELVN